MQLISQKIVKAMRLSKWFELEVSGYTYNSLMKALRNKDVKINGQRINQDCDLQTGDKIEIYLPEKSIKHEIDVVYEDDNILIVNKPAGILSVEDSEKIQSMELMVKKKYPNALPAHRLDRNTTGLMMFAKSEESLKLLIEATKNGEIEKHYLAWVYGKFPKMLKEKAYIFVDSKRAHSIISSLKKPKYNEIETAFKLIKTNGEFSLIEVALHSGKLHQIRAHAAFLGHALVGDGLYADNEEFNKTKFKHHQLLAYSIEFKINKNNRLNYLNNKKILLNNEKFVNLITI